jgi:hypothetical protein
MNKFFKIIVFVSLIVLCAFSFGIKAFETFLDYFTQTPPIPLRTFNYLIPALITLTVAFMTILHFFRTIISHHNIRQIPIWTNKIAIRVSILLVLLYALIWQTNYFIWIMHKPDIVSILVDFISILCLVFMAFIFVSPYRVGIRYL